MATVRTFESGATRNLEADKFDFEGFLSPLVIEAYGRYMHANRVLPDGTLRESDNWQKGIPFVVYAKSLWRHFFAFWKAHRGYPDAEGLEESLCAILFNASGYLHERLRLESGTQQEVTEVVTLGHAYEAPLPPILEIDDDDNMGLKAGEAFSVPVESLGRDA
jgi:hypothetical protein